MPLSKIADRFIELFGICDRCGQAARYNYNKVAMDGQVKLGASETYGVCCENCYDFLTPKAVESLL